MRTAAVPARADYAADCSTASHRATMAVTMVIAHASSQYCPWREKWDPLRRLGLTPLAELGVDRENTRGNLHFLSAFRARKVPLLVGSRRTSCASGGVERRE
jgi:hypothetical protein